MRAQTSLSTRCRGWLLVLAGIAGTGALAGCNKDQAPGAEASAAAAPGGAATAASASAQAQLKLVTPTLGGNVLAVGDHQLELAVFENGQVQALVYAPGGQALAPEALPKVTAALRTKGGGRHIAALAWDAPHACLQGRAALDAALVVDPLEISLDVGGRVSTGTLAQYAILPFARFGGSVLAVGGYAVELVTKPDVVAAYVLDASGKAQGGADFSLQLQLGAEAANQLALKWDPARASFVAALDGKLDLTSQPLRLALTTAGKTYLGATASLNALATTRLGARAQLDARAQAGLELPAPKLDAKLAAGAKAAGNAKANLAGGAQAGVSAPLPKASANVSASKSASASAGTKTSSSGAKAKADVKAGVSFGFGK